VADVVREEVVGTENGGASIGRITIASAALLSALLLGLTQSAIAGGQAGANPSTPIPAATILAAADAYEGETVMIQGTVARVERAVFPNRRPYYTLSVEDARATLTVFSWSPPSVKEGDRVEAVGIFHIWRYNIHHMIESVRITRLEKGR
jgi:hypothetical protein